MSVAAPPQSRSPKPLLAPIPHGVQPSLLLPSPQLVRIDLQPSVTTEDSGRGDILNVGGFNDAVFSVVAAFLADDGGRLVAEVEALDF